MSNTDSEVVGHLWTSIKADYLNDAKALRSGTMSVS